jgi:phosphoribosyl-AMP cyclohydrolase
MKINFDKMQGLAPAIVQDEATGEVLMLGFMNRDALRMTRDSGYATFFSRTRGLLWTKGETSGNKLLVISILVDCDDDTLLLKVKRLGGGNVCHTEERSCFYRKFQ